MNWKPEADAPYVTLSDLLSRLAQQLDMDPHEAQQLDEAVLLIARNLGISPSGVVVVASARGPEIQLPNPRERDGLLTVAAFLADPDSPKTRHRAPRWEPGRAGRQAPPRFTLAEGDEAEGFQP